MLTLNSSTKVGTRERRITGYCNLLMNTQHKEANCDTKKHKRGKSERLYVLQEIEAKLLSG